MFLAREWEMFYTHSKTGDEDLVDQISIHETNQRFILDIDANYLITDGYDRELEPICSTYVSRLVFDLIVDGVKKRGFVEFIGEL